jgi:hypothetical protein
VPRNGDVRNRPDPEEHFLLPGRLRRSGTPCAKAPFAAADGLEQQAQPLQCSTVDSHFCFHLRQPQVNAVLSAANTVDI